MFCSNRYGSVLIGYVLIHRRGRRVNSFGRSVVHFGCAEEAGHGRRTERDEGRIISVEVFRLRLEAAVD